MLERLRAAARAWIAPPCPSPQQYWAETGTTVGWWKAL